MQYYVVPIYILYVLYKSKIIISINSNEKKFIEL